MREREVHEARVRGEFAVVQRLLRGVPVFDEDVGRGHQFAQGGDPFVACQVKGHDAFAEVVPGLLD